MFPRLLAGAVALFDGDPAFVVAINPGGARDGISEFARHGGGDLKMGFARANPNRTHFAAGHMTPAA